MNNRGVYFIANDEVFDLAIAFLNSFRKYNPDISLCLIPYSSDIRRLEELRDRYNFTIYPNTELYDWCDKASLRFHKKVFGQYRKLVMWEGGFEEFIYIDVDTVVLRNIDFVFDFLAEYDFVTSHSNMPHIVKYTWKKSIYKAGQLTREEIGYAGNTGFIASKRGALTLDGAKGKIERAINLLRHMPYFSYEQPFLNYLIVTSGKRYTSLFVLWYKKVCQGIALEQWAGTKGRAVRNGQIILQCHPVFLVHWAGLWSATWFDKMVFYMLSGLGIKDKKDKPSVRFFMPYKRLWQHYRFLQRDSITTGKGVV